MHTLARIALLLVHIAGGALAVTALLSAWNFRLLLDLLAGGRAIWIVFVPIDLVFSFTSKCLIPATLALAGLLAVAEVGRMLLRLLRRRSEPGRGARLRGWLRVTLWCLLAEIIVTLVARLAAIAFSKLGVSVPSWILYAITGLAAAMAAMTCGSIVLRWIQGRPEVDVALRLRVLLYTVLACVLVQAFVMSTAETFKGPFRVRYPVAAEILAAFFYAAYALWGVSLPALRRRVSSRKRRVLDIVCTNLALALILGEVGLRVVAAYSPTPLLVTDTSSGQIRRDSQRQPPGALRFGFPMNQSGHYDAEFVPSAAAAKPIVVSIGDSFSYGVVPHAYHFTTVAEREFAGVDVYNMGYPGIGPSDYRYLLENEALPLEPDLIVVQLFLGNDVAANSGDTGSARWYDADRYLLAVVYHRLQILREAEVGDWTAASERDGKTASELESEYPWLVDPLLEKPSFEREVFLDLETQNARTLCVSNDVVYQRFFEELEKIERAAGDVPLAFVLIPDEFQVEDSLWEVVEPRSGQDLDRELPQRKLAEWWGGRDRPVLDLLPVLRSVEPLHDGRRHLYHLHDTHFNARGNEVAGKAMADFIKPLLARGNQHDYTPRKIAISVPGPSPSNDLLPEMAFNRAAEITQAYGRVLQDLTSGESRVLSVARLPQPKRIVEHALFRMMETLSKPEDREFLIAGVRRLAYFQAGVGDAGADPDAAGPDEQKWQSLVAAELDRINGRLEAEGY